MRHGTSRSSCFATRTAFSNAEIFSHAIKTLRRGPVVGVPTAGGVISTGAVSIMDVGTMRLPFRGWFVSGTGEDMELNGCVPHIVVWPEPGQMPQGKDVQLEKALQVLYETTKAFEPDRSRSCVMRPSVTECRRCRAAEEFDIAEFDVAA